MDDPQDSQGAGEEFPEQAPYVEEETPAVERGLAQFAFIREERDREVRLLFRDAPPVEIARTFRAAGAYLISIAGETVRHRDPHADHPEDIVEESAHPGAPQSAPSLAPGGTVVRYFFSLADTVYTVSITSGTGLVDSVAGIFPASSLSERQLSARLGLVFTHQTEEAG